MLDRLLPWRCSHPRPPTTETTDLGYRTVRTPNCVFAHRVRVTRHICPDCGETVEIRRSLDEESVIPHSAIDSYPPDIETTRAFRRDD